MSRTDKTPVNKWRLQELNHLLRQTGFRQTNENRLILQRVLTVQTTHDEAKKMMTTTALSEILEKKHEK